MTAHVAGAPLEELLVPALSLVGVAVLAGRGVLASTGRARRRRAPVEGCRHR